MADEKFSQFVTQGSISTGNTLVGLSSGINVQFNPFAFADDLTISTLTVGQGNFKDSFGTNGAFGSSALGSNVSGSNNSAFGYASLSAVSAGGANSAFGSGSGQSNDGINNVYVGFNSGALLGVTANGDNNVFLGSYSGNGGGNVSGYDMQAGSHNTFVGVFATGNSTTINGSIAIGYFSVSDAATGSTSGTFGPGIAFGASGFPVGFRGDGTAIPAGSQHYWRMKVNDTYYQIPLITDEAALLWPASGTLATTAQLPSSGSPLAATSGGTGVSNSFNLTINAASTINQNVSTNATPTFTTIKTTPVASAASTLVLGTAYQNTLGYDVILIAYLDIASATAAAILSGVGPTSTPTQQTVIASITTATDVFIPVTVYLPNNYYVNISTTGTISASVSGQQVTPV